MNGRAPGLTDVVADVVVVGAGLAGLVAARKLREAGAAVLVLEAQDRVGGRTYTVRADGVPLEMGGQWIGPAQHRIVALARELGVETFESEVPGKTVFLYGGRREEYEGATPSLEPAALEELEAAYGALAGLAKTVPGDAPWKAAEAGAWDGQTLETWKLGRLSREDARFYFDLAVRSLYACEPREVSLLGVLADLASSGARGGLFEVEASVEEFRFLGGAQEVSERLARELEDAVVLGAPVRRIVQEPGGPVRVESGRGTAAAGAVIVTVPPALRGRIEYQPALPPAHDGLAQRMPMGAVVKCHAVYDEPFWRGRDLSGRAEGDIAPVGVVVDNSPPDGSAGVLTGFVLGSGARGWGRRGAARRRGAVVDCFARYFGEEARRVRAYDELDWGAQPYSRGGYGGVPAPGTLLDYGPALREPFGRIHWAGAETATLWGGYMDGAVQSGERAAGEVLAGVASGTRAAGG